MSTDEQRRPSADPTQDELVPLMADRLTAVIESRMSRDLAWLQDDGETVIRLNPEEAGWHIAWLYKTGDIVSGLPPLEAGAERADRLEAALRKAREQLLIEHGHDSDSDANWPACRIVHPVLDEARAALGDG